MHNRFPKFARMANSKSRRFAAGAAAGLLSIALAWCAELEGDEAKPPKSEPDEQAEEDERVSVAVARDRAKLLHQVYASTLRVMHQRYFHGDNAAVPARAMEDVFSEIAWRSKVEAKWISANLQPMGVNHEPRSEFEKQAAKEISAGKEEFETVEKGNYRRAGSIPLSSGCIKCHAGFLGTAPKTPRYAGLVISVPITKD
jgi:hypothetical protein